MRYIGCGKGGSCDDFYDDITYEILYQKRAYYGIRFINHGKRVAKNVSIKFKPDFLETIPEKFRNQLQKQKNRTFILGNEQSYDIYFGNNEYRKSETIVSIEGTITYEDYKSKYCEPLYVDFSNYATFFSVNSDTEDLIKAIKRQTETIEQLCNSVNNLKQNDLYRDEDS